MSKKLFERFEEHTARLEEMILIAGVLESPTEQLMNFLTDTELENIEECFGKLPEAASEAFDDGDSEAAADWLYRAKRFGYLINMATPVMKWDGTGSLFSWGFYSTRWFYGDTLEQALDLGFAWVAEQRAKEKKEAKASKGGGK